MKPLVTPPEVLDTAFSPYEQADSRILNDSRIEAIQLKFLAPVFGKLYPALCEGRHPEFTETYVKPALAYFVKYALIPELTARTANIGVLRNIPPNGKPATAEEIALLRRETRNTARSLLNKALGYLQENRASFPEYVPDEHPRSRRSIQGGIIL